MREDELGELGGVASEGAVGGSLSEAGATSSPISCLQERGEGEASVLLAGGGVAAPARQGRPDPSSEAALSRGGADQEAAVLSVHAIGELKISSARACGNGDGAFAAVHDPAAEEEGYGRALLAPADLERLKTVIAEGGFMTIEAVRAFVKQNTVKGGQTCAPDPEVMLLIDTRTNYRIFVAGDNVYTRGELLEHFPFEEFGTTPEAIFVQQEVGVFPPKNHAAEAPLGAACEFVARDVGDQEEFVRIEDLVGRAARRGYKPRRRAPTRVVKTKVFLGKARWEDFSMLKRFARIFQRLAGVPLLAGGGGPLAICDAEQTLARLARLARERQALAALEAKAEALQQKEEELRVREAALFRAPLPARDGAAAP
jgi:hypothetical protein